MRRVSLFYFLFLLSLTCCISAQDLIDQERIPVTSPGVDTGWPKAAVNGNGEIGLFAMWYGGANAPDGIIFRKLDKEGKPIGPQKIVYKTNSEETRGFWIQDVVWAKDNYFVAVQNRHENRFVLLKFSQDGVLKKQLHHNHGKRVNSHQYFINGKIFGDEIYFYQTTTEGFISISGTKNRPGEKGEALTENYLLKLNIDATTDLTKIDLLKPTNKQVACFGLSLDADKIVAMFATISPREDGEYYNPRIVTYDPVSNKISNPKKLNFASEWGAAWGLAQAPLWTGAGHLISYRKYNRSSLYNYSYVFDNKGNTVWGPTDYYENGTDQLHATSKIVGSWAIFDCLDEDREAMAAVILGKKGKHAKNIFVTESRNDGDAFDPHTIGSVFTGNHLVFYFVGSTQDVLQVFTKSIPTPKPIRDGVAFFQAGSKSFADGARNLIWSTVGSESVTLKHDGKEYTNLPPKYTFLLKDANLNKPVELTFTSAAGKTYSRKLNLK